jgi:hypothetical protein
MTHAYPPVKYIEKTRSYYEAQGFEIPYRWASHDSAPFTVLQKPLSESRIGLASTATTYPRMLLEHRTVEACENEDLPIKLYAEDLAWDRKATHLNDRESFFPANVLDQFAKRGIIGGISPRSYFLPTEYSQRKTSELDAREVLKYCREDRVDALMLVPL